MEKMSVSCKCLNVVVKLDGTDTESLPRFDLDTYLNLKKRQQQQESTPAPATTPSDDHFLFFKEALGPVRCAAIETQYAALLRTERIFDQWDLCQCRNCECYVFARRPHHLVTEDEASITCLVNATLMTNQEQLSARMADGNYSAAFGIVLNGSSLNYSDLAAKGKLLSKAKSDNPFVAVIRAYMERETEAANERIQRFTEQEFAVLKVKRERAEQDCLILAKLANNTVPELLLSSSNNNSSSSNTSGNNDTLVGEANAPNVDKSTSPMATAPSSGTNLTDSTSGSQLETPPPTPEYQPMSTGNSPPMSMSTANRQPTLIATSTPSASSSIANNDQPTSPYAPRLRSIQATPIRTNLSYNSSSNSNNNNIVSYNNNTRGAISKTTTNTHSSTNSLTMNYGSSIPPHHQQQLSSYESDCMFDIDGMENDKSPLSNTLSDEEELGFDESIGNNNDDGMYIPSRQLGGRQNGTGGASAAGSFCIAKSLPISMPQVMTQFRGNEEDFEEMNEDNVDIAASIKALARSVHGDTVFGDLPRPQIQRFTTQI